MGQCSISSSISSSFLSSLSKTTNKSLSAVMLSKGRLLDKKKKQNHGKNMDYGQLKKAKVCPIAILAREVSSVLTFGFLFEGADLLPHGSHMREMSLYETEGSTHWFSAGERASPSNPCIGDCSTKEPKLKTCLVSSFSVIARVRSQCMQTWNLPGRVSSRGDLVAFPSSFVLPFFGVAKQHSHFCCHVQVKWLHLLLSSQHMLLWCDPLLD